MPGLENRDFTTPDETRSPSKTRVELVNLGGGQIGRYTFEPGWQWSECIKPVAGTDSCQVEHIGYVGAVVGVDSTRSGAGSVAKARGADDAAAWARGRSVS